MFTPRHFAMFCFVCLQMIPSTSGDSNVKNISGFEGENITMSFKTPKSNDNITLITCNKCSSEKNETVFSFNDGHNEEVNDLYDGRMEWGARQNEEYVDVIPKNLTLNDTAEYNCCITRGDKKDKTDTKTCSSVFLHVEPSGQNKGHGEDRRTEDEAGDNRHGREHGLIVLAVIDALIIIVATVMCMRHMRKTPSPSAGSDPEHDGLLEQVGSEREAEVCWLSAILHEDDEDPADQPAESVTERRVCTSQEDQCAA